MHSFHNVIRFQLPVKMLIISLFRFVLVHFMSLYYDFCVSYNRTSCHTN